MKNIGHVNLLYSHATSAMYYASDISSIIINFSLRLMDEMQLCVHQHVD